MSLSMLWYVALRWCTTATAIELSCTAEICEAGLINRFFSEVLRSNFLRLYSEPNFFSHIFTNLFHQRKILIRQHLSSLKILNHTGGRKFQQLIEVQWPLESIHYSYQCETTEKRGKRRFVTFFIFLWNQDRPSYRVFVFKSCERCRVVQAHGRVHSTSCTWNMVFPELHW